MKLKTTGLKKIYPNGAVGVENINLEINDGRFIVLLGPSGCGKSTLLRLISGLENPTNGTIHLDGVDITDWEPKRRDIAMVFQNYALYPHMTVRENLEFGLKSRRIPKDIRNNSIEWAAGLLELNDYLDRKPKELSGGQRQRVALGRAIVRKPKLYLYDEPLSNLDAELRMKMRGEIISLHKRVVGTSIYVTHDQTEAMSLADKIYIMKEGEIISCGVPSELYEKPPDLFTAGFLGFPAMNLLGGIFADNRFTTAGGVHIGFEESVKYTGEKPERATLGFRPEDIRLAENGNLEGTIVSLESMGRYYLLVMEIEKGEMVKVISNDKYNVGENISAQIDSKNIYLFDKESGKLIE